MLTVYLHGISTANPSAASTTTYLTSLRKFVANSPQIFFGDVGPDAVNGVVDAVLPLFRSNIFVIREEAVKTILQLFKFNWLSLGNFSRSKVAVLIAFESLIAKMISPERRDLLETGVQVRNSIDSYLYIYFHWLLT